MSIGSHTVVKWYEAGTVKQKVNQYFEEVGNSEVPF